MQDMPAFIHARFLFALAVLESIDRFKQRLQRLAQLGGARIALSPAYAHALLDKGLPVQLPRKLLQSAQAGNVLAQELRAEQAVFLRDPALEVLDELHGLIV